jgi:hypothetical protein
MNIDKIVELVKPHITVAGLPSLLRAIDIACQEVYEDGLRRLGRRMFDEGSSDPDPYEKQEFRISFAFGYVDTKDIAAAFRNRLASAPNGPDTEQDANKREEIVRLMLELERTKRSPAFTVET